jgi:hypothetical protein
MSAEPPLRRGLAFAPRPPPPLSKQGVRPALPCQLSQVHISFPPPPPVLRCRCAT